VVVGGVFEVGVAVLRLAFMQLMHLLCLTAPLYPKTHTGAPPQLVFSQYSATLEWLQERLPQEGLSFRTVTGSMGMKQRAKAIEVRRDHLVATPAVACWV